MLRIVRSWGIILGTAIVSISIVYFSIPMSNAAQSRFDVILVLGYPMNGDGSISANARAGVLEGIRQYRAGAAPRLLMSGGAAHNRFVEAQGMAEFARSQGIPASAILTEGQSRNTVQNAYYSFRVMQAHDWQSALVIGIPSHLRRASLIFRYYPFAWRMQAAEWPPETGFWRRAWFWSSEAVYTTYVRIFGFPGSQQQYVPRIHFTPPQL